MKITIRMVSGKEITFYNSKYKTLAEWMEENFAGEGAWFSLNKHSESVLRFENMESITAEEEKNE